MGEGIFNLVYFTFLHNYDVLGFSLATIVSLVLLIKHPTRQHVFFFIGFLLLILNFEYQKHIVQGLAEQTADILFTTEGNYRAQWLTRIAFYHLAPLLLWLAGWGGVVLGIVNPQKKGD